MEIINNTIGRIDIYMEKIFSNRYYSSIITLVLILYTSVIAPKLPNSILKLFDYSIFRVLILSLVLYYGNKNTKLSIIIAVGFIISMNLLSKRKMFENFTELQSDLQSDLDQTNGSFEVPDSNELDQNSNFVNTSIESPSNQQQPSIESPSNQQQQPSIESPSNQSQQPSIESPSNQSQQPSNSDSIQMTETPNESPQPNMVNSSEEQNDNLSDEEITHEKEKGETCMIVGNKSNCLKNLYCDPTNRKCRKKIENETCNILENDSDDCADDLYCDKKTKLCKRI